MDMQEYWVPIIGTENRYEVSSLGRVRSTGRYVNYHIKGKKKWSKSTIQKQRKRRGKYLSVQLHLSNKKCRIFCTL